MNKIICDICGTTYPESSECCPICGCSKDVADLLDADMNSEDFVEETVEESNYRPVANRKKGIFDFDEVNPEEEDEVDYEEDEKFNEDFEDEDEDDEQEEEPRHNTFVVILLTVLIVVLLGVAGFIFVRYFLPNMREEDITPATTAVQEAETTAPATEPTVPCKQMVMTNAGVAELSAEGQQFLLHVKPLPENTTDVIIYTSADESIATVTEDGKITAVSEGETIIYISCGEPVIECPVIVKYVEETVPPTTEAMIEETETAAETTAVEEPAATEEIQPAEESNSNTGLKDVKLKLKRTDIQLGVYYQFQLVLDCDLAPEDVTWTSEHPHIATVDEQGNVTAVKAGTTSVTAQYGDQEVQCMVRCIWY